nr:MMPL family transporter [Ideonella livida]
MLFSHRALVLALCLLLTVVLGWQASKLRLNADFDKMVPAHHPFIVHATTHRADLKELGNALRVAVRAPEGRTVFDPDYLAALQQLSDELLLLPGVDRAYVKSLWTPNTRWVAVTEEGLEGGRVIPDSYDGSPRSLEEVRQNVERAGLLGQMVSADLRASVIFLPLLGRDPQTGQALDYRALSERLEQIRARQAEKGISLHITGFAKVMGDMIAGLTQVLMFFAAAVALAAVMVWAYTRCWRSTGLVVACSMVAVVWQLGLLPLLGFGLDPYSLLVPFLVFAIGMSHGAQKMNGIMQDVGRGLAPLVAARLTFRRLFMAGLTALLCDAVGFAVLLAIDIRVIQELALSASVGVAALIVTNLVLLPILLSFTGVSPKAAQRSLRAESAAWAASGEQSENSGRFKPQAGLWAVLDRFTQRRTAMWTVGVAATLGLAGHAVSLHLRIGDVDPGAPELRADSRYNRDVAYMNQAFGAASDVLAVMVTTPKGQCARHATLAAVDDLEWTLRQVPGVLSTHSLAGLSRRLIAGMSEGSLKWYELVPNQGLLNAASARAPRELINRSCSLLPVMVYLADHGADTLQRVVATVEGFAAAHDTAEVKFLLAAGNAGIEAATNAEVAQASRQMLWGVYAAVVLLCFVAFRSWRAVLCAVLPLVLTSVLAEALMVGLGMGVKVATLPVIALGVGIGVDYGLYVLSILLAHRRQGATLSQSYHQALLFTGKVVLLTGATLAAGVATWVGSPIRFQADMGLLLAFMFLLNMVGALVLLPALARLLLPDLTPQLAARPDLPAAPRPAPVQPLPVR